MGNSFLLGSESQKNPQFMQSIGKERGIYKGEVWFFRKVSENTKLDALPDFDRPADNKITQKIPLLITPGIIRAASNVIADKAKDMPGYQLHAYRKSETADSPQLIRDSDHARAWRLMIQKHGAGWRLHYWQIPTAQGYQIEFANICKESERKIY